MFVKFRDRDRDRADKFLKQGDNFGLACFKNGRHVSLF